MDTYSIFREIADSWVLLAMFVGFLGICVWAFRPGARPAQDEAAKAIFRNETRPAFAGGATENADRMMAGQKKEAR